MQQYFPYNSALHCVKIQVLYKKAYNAGKCISYFYLNQTMDLMLANVYFLNRENYGGKSPNDQCNLTN